MIASDHQTLAHDPQEFTLAHSPRAMVFVNGETLCWGHTPTDYAVTSLTTSTTVDVSTPIPTATSTGSVGGMGMGALSGLGSYMTLGLGAKAKPCVVSLNESEALIAKDSESLQLSDIFFYNADGIRQRIHRWKRRQVVQK